MNDLFRTIFGVPFDDRYGHDGRRMGGIPPDDNPVNVTGNGGNDDDDDDNDDSMRMNPRNGTGVFGFPFFNDPVDIHKHFERLVEEMNKTFGMFGFGGSNALNWEDDERDVSSYISDHPEGKGESLRDSYLKQPDCSCDKVNQNDINIKLKTDDFEPSTSGFLNSEAHISLPKVYSKSVFIQTVKRPDGSIETIKKVRDHTGNEKTTITQSNVNDPLPPPQQGPIEPMKEDTSRISFLKKFFSF